MSDRTPRPVNGPIVEAGVYDVPDEQYHADQLCDVPTLSSSICKILVEQRPLHAWMAHPRLNSGFVATSRDLFDAGRAAHAAILGQPELVRVIEANDWRPKAAKAARDEARAAGLTPILAGKAAEIERMAAAVRRQILSHEDFPNAFSNGRPEQTLVWFEGEGADRIGFRIRLDWLPSRGTIFHDLKSTADNAGRDWSRRTLFNTGADIQAALYCRGIRAVLGVQNPIFVFVVVENFAPHCLMMHTLDPGAMAAAERKVDHAIQWWRWCMRHGAWPAYPRRTNWVEAPPWEKARAEELAPSRPTDPAAEMAAFRAWEAWQAPAIEGVEE